MFLVADETRGENRIPPIADSYRSYEPKASTNCIEVRRQSFVQLLYSINHVMAAISRLVAVKVYVAGIYVYCTITLPSISSIHDCNSNFPGSSKYRTCIDVPSKQTNHLIKCPSQHRPPSRHFPPPRRRPPLRPRPPRRLPPPPCSPPPY